MKEEEIWSGAKLWHGCSRSCIDFFKCSTACLCFCLLFINLKRMSLIFHWLSGELRIGKVKQMHFIERNTLFYSCIKYRAHFVHLIFCYFVAGIALTRVEKAIITIAIPWSVLRAQKRALLHRNKNGWLRWPVSAPRQGLVTFCQQQQITMEATSKEDHGHGAHLDKE